MRLYFSIVSYMMMIALFLDVVNAYQQAPGPSIPCYIEADEAIQVWYKRRFGKDIDPRTEVIPLFGALQGHPEAGVLWEHMINDILVNKLKFKQVPHEQNLYLGSSAG